MVWQASALDLAPVEWAEGPAAIDRAGRAAA